MQKWLKLSEKIKKIQKFSRYWYGGSYLGAKAGLEFLSLKKKQLKYLCRTPYVR